MIRFSVHLSSRVLSPLGGITSSLDGSRRCFSKVGDGGSQTYEKAFSRSGQNERARRIYMTKDAAFKHLFQDPDDSSKVIDFTNSILAKYDETPITSTKVSHMDTVFRGIRDGEKSINFDILFKESQEHDSRIFNLEMQNSEISPKRWILYNSLCNATLAASGIHYSKLQRIFTIVIMNCPTATTEDYYRLIGKDRGVQLENSPAIIVLNMFNLPRVLPPNYTRLDAWLHMLKYCNRGMDERVLDDPSSPLTKAYHDFQKFQESFVEKSARDPKTQMKEKGKTWSMFFRDLKEKTKE